MWPFRQRKTIQVTWDMEIARTADNQFLSNFSECCKCHHLINKAFIKVVRHKYEHPYIEDIEERFCPNCAPEWDLTVTISWGDYRTHYYKRIPAVPEAFEEVNLPAEAPKPPGENVNMGGVDSGATLGPTSEERTVRMALERIQTEGLEALARLRAQSKAEPRGKAKARAGVEARAKAKGEARVKAGETQATAFRARMARAAAEDRKRERAAKAKKARPRTKKPTK